MTLPEAQAAFRQSPGRQTALAYMDASIAEFEDAGTDDWAMLVLSEACKDIRDWLMNTP